MITNRDSNLCRICLLSSNDNQSIFSTNQNYFKNKTTLDLSEKLRLYGGIEVVHNDGLPDHICAKCILKVNTAHELREQCQQADIKLRELYGKAMKKDDSLKRVILKDQYCQTDNDFITLMKEESSFTFVQNDLSVLNEDSTSNLQSMIIKNDNVSDNVNQLVNDLKSNNEQIQDTDNKYEQSMQEVAVIKREAYRTRRLTMFKRVTSMENLKNHKERQRQYIKKNGNTKHDNIEKDSLLNMENTYNKINRVSSVSSELNLECPHCKRCYSSKKSLERHTLTHSDKKFKCEKCDKQFFHIDKLLQHGKLHRPKEKSKLIPCKICNKSFRKTDTMVRHLNVHKRANPKEVFSILKEIRDRRKLENSIQSLEMNNQISIKNKKLINSDSKNMIKELDKQISDIDDKIDNVYTSNSDSNSDNKSDSLETIVLYHCKHCTKCYSTERSLQRHLLMHDEKKFVCNVCNMKFFRQDRLKSHRDRYGHDEDKDCSIPLKPTDDKSAIKLINSWIREELDSDNEGKGFPCKICGKSYDTKKSLLKHQMNTHDMQEENCVNCGKNCTCTVKFKGALKYNEKVKSFTCDECNKTFEKEIKLQKHMRIHERTKEQQDSNFKRFLCHICSKTFRQNTGLMFHMRTHTGYKPHVCKYCGRGFTSNSNCINHERTHTGDRPFVCHFCSAAFAKSCTLKAHITTHTGEANYHCKTCGKSFRRLKYLKEHRFTHTGEKPYACKICGTAYSHSGSLFVHEKKCKAQYNNYQTSTSQNSQSYCQPQTNVCTTTPVVTDVAPVISTLPQSHLNNINSALCSQANKTYVDSLQRMNTHAAATAAVVGTSTLPVHPSPDIPDVASAVRNIAIIGQVFYS